MFMNKWLKNLLASPHLGPGIFGEMVVNTVKSENSDLWTYFKVRLNFQKYINITMIFDESKDPPDVHGQN